MIALCSESQGRARSVGRAIGRAGERAAESFLSVARDRRGSVLFVVVAVLVVMLASVGLAVDLGRGYVEKLHIGRAVDAGALAAARALRLGQDVAEDEAEAVATANGITDGVGTIETDLTFGTNAAGESTVLFAANRTVPTTFMRIVGLRQMNVSASGLAAVPPLDVVLILDTSGSLLAADAFDDLQDAARTFLDFFDDDIDQLGLVTFQLSAHDQFILDGDFTDPINDEIDIMLSAGDTNIQEGLRLGRAQITGGTARPEAAKVIVFFTDGRATAFRGNLGAPAVDRVMAAFTTGNNIRGYFNNPDALPDYVLAAPNGCNNVGTCFGMNGTQARTQSANLGATQADLIRGDDVLLYTIGLGNLANPPLAPDTVYLKQLANVDGMTNPSQPRGKFYFAPSGAQLEAVFQEVARDLIVRLAG
jgi:Flp pilus assembly protein TadG